MTKRLINPKLIKESHLDDYDQFGYNREDDYASSTDINIDLEDHIIDLMVDVMMENIGTSRPEDLSQEELMDGLIYKRIGQKVLDYLESHPGRFENMAAAAAKHVNELVGEKLKTKLFESASSYKILKENVKLMEAVLEDDDLDPAQALGVNPKAKTPFLARMFDKLGSMFQKGTQKYDPSQQIKTPSTALNALDTKLQNVKKLEGSFKQNVLQHSNAAHRYYAAIVDLLVAFDTYLDGIPEEKRGVYERLVLKSVKGFYNNFASELQAAKSQMDAISSDANKYGYDLKSMIDRVPAQRIG